MRIGPQLYGYNGFDLTRAPLQLTVTGTDNSTNKTNNAASTSSSTLTQLNTLIKELRYLVQNPEPFVNQPTTATTNSTTTQSTTGSVKQAQYRYETIQEPHSYELSQARVNGLNSAQISQLQLLNYDGSSGAHVINGSITQTATAATLQITGDADGLIEQTADYYLETDEGNFTFQTTEGESLQTVATRISSQTQAAGVQARVQGNNLVFENQRLGSASRITLTRTDEAETTITGQNSQHITNLNVQHQTAGTSDTLSGSVLSQAQAAELVYQGTSDGEIAGTATFRLTGALGSLVATVTEGETLSAVATRLNQQTSSTGVIVTQDGNTLRLTSTQQGADQLVRIDQLVQDAATQVTGRNSAQVAGLTVNNITRGSTEVLNGQVQTAATKGSLTLAGANGNVISSATFQLTGAQGSANISITKNETLDSVAIRINQLTTDTGVTARVSSNDLILESANYGSTESVQVSSLNVPYEVTVSGVNAAQISLFNVQSFTDGATQNFTGSVTQVSELAQSRYDGNSGNIDKNATITITGNLGSHQFTAVEGQTLQSFIDLVNAESATTGVTATLGSNRILFNSAEVGSAQFVRIVVDSGRFDIRDDNAQGYAYGKDAKATINGTNLTAVGNDFSFSNANGSYDFSVVQDFQGTISQINVTSTAGTFTLSGGNGNGSSSGTDVTAVINGVQYTGTGNTVNATGAHGQYTFDFAGGFTGNFNTITAQSVLDDFTFTGGDNTGTANGTDFVARVNGLDYHSRNSTVTVSTANGSYDLEFDSNHVGAFDAVTIATSGEETRTSAFGQDAEATLNGQQLTGQGNWFQYEDGQSTFAFTAAEGFVGQIDPLTIQNEISTITTIAQRTIAVLIPNSENKSESITNPEPVQKTSTVKERLANIYQSIDQLLAEPRTTSSQTTSAITNNERKSTITATASKSLFQVLPSKYSLNNSTVQLLNNNANLVSDGIDYQG